MKQRSTVMAACVAALAAAQVLAPVATAQTAGALRLKARLVAVEGGTITLQPLPDDTKAGDPNAAPAAPRRVALLPDTRYVQSAPGSFAAIKTGDYAGAAVSLDRDGNLRADTVYLYAQALRGTGEGRFTDRDRLLVNGTVTKIEAQAGAGILTLHYRGATLTQTGKGPPVCEGRATPAPFASALACEGDAVIRVPAGASIAALTVGDRAILVAGATVTATLARVGDREVTPGLVVEQPSVEKPKSSP